MESKLYLYPSWIRVWHWGNALFFLVLIITGLSMQYSDPQYPIIRFDWAVSLHNITGIAVLAFYLYFVAGNRISGNRRYYAIDKKDFGKELRMQFSYYTSGIFRGEKPYFPVSAERKFNPLQKLSYVLAMYYLMPVLIVSGLLLLFPELIPVQVAGWSGIHMVAIVHVVSGFFLSVFLAVHVYFCTIGSTVWSNFKGMITGYHTPH